MVRGLWFVVCGLLFLNGLSESAEADIKANEERPCEAEPKQSVVALLWTC